jgi:hypothetical protein
MAAKKCPRCGEVKSAAAFPVSKNRSRPNCKTCEAARMRRLRAEGCKVGRPTDTGGLSHIEIGRRLGIPKSTVQQIEARALKKLRAAAMELFGLSELDPIAPLARTALTLHVQLAGGWR